MSAIAISSTIASSPFLISSRRIGSRAAAAARVHAAAVRISMLPWSSRRAVAPGGTRVVASYSSTRSGPGRGVGSRSARPITGVASRPCARPNHALRSLPGAGRCAADGASRQPPGALPMAVRHARGQPQVHDRDRVVERRVAVLALVLGGEGLAQARRRRPPRRRARHRAPGSSARRTGPRSAGRAPDEAPAGRRRPRPRAPGRPRPRAPGRRRRRRAGPSPRAAAGTCARRGARDRPRAGRPR